MLSHVAIKRHCFLEIAQWNVKDFKKLPSCEEPARRGGRGNAEGVGWLFFGLTSCFSVRNQRTTTLLR